MERKLTVSNITNAYDCWLRVLQLQPVMLLRFRKLLLRGADAKMCRVNVTCHKGKNL